MNIDISQKYITGEAERGKFAVLDPTYLSSLGYNLSAGSGRYAVLTYDVAGATSTPASPASSSTTPIASSALSIPLTGAAVELGTELTIDPLAKLIRISFTGSGDVNITYDGTTPTSGDGGEIWFKGGILEVNPTVAGSIKLIKATTTNSSVYVTQFA